METDTNSYQSEFVPVSCKCPLVLLVRKSTFDCDFHFSLWRSTLTIHFWFCVLSAIDFVSVGRRSWQVVREAKNAVSVAVRKLKLPWVKLRNCREYIEIAVSKIEIAVSKIEIAVSKIEIAVSKVEIAVSKTEIAVSKIEIAVSKVEIAVSKIEIPVSKIEIAVSKVEIAVSKLKLPWVKLKLPWHFWATVETVLLKLINFSWRKKLLIFASIISPSKIILFEK